MATAKEYFEKSTRLEFGRELTLVGNGVPIAVPMKVVNDFEGGSRYIKVYIPECSHPDGVLCAVLEKHQALLESADEVRPEWV